MSVPRAGVLAVALTVALTAGAACSRRDPGSPDGAPTRRDGPPAARRDLPAPPPGGTAALGLKWDWARMAAYTPTLKRFPGGDTFYELVWCDVERRQGVRDWTAIDEVVDGAALVGFRVALKIRVGSCWATGRRLEARGEKEKTASLEPDDLGRYRGFVRAVVARYRPRGVNAYAVENEVNGPNFWRSSPAAYERLVRAAAEEIRAGDPDVVIFDSGVSSTAYGAGIARWLLDRGEPDQALAAYRAYYDRRFAARGSQLPRVDDAAGLASALRSGQPARNLEFLDVSFGLAHDGIVDAWQLHFYERWDNVPTLLSYLRARLPAGMPLESWETGIFWPKAGGDLTAAAEETAKVVSLLLAGGVRRVIWLPAAADPSARRAEDEIRWALFDQDGLPRPAARVFESMAGAAAGSVPAALGGELSGVALGGAQRTLLVLWSSDGTVLAGPAPAGARVRGTAGNAVAWGDDGLRVGEEPLLVELAEPAGQALRRLPDADGRAGGAG